MFLSNGFIVFVMAKLSKIWKSKEISFPTKMKTVQVPRDVHPVVWL
jgi:hypothetical protein